MTGWAGEGHTHWSELLQPGDPDRAWNYFYERYKGPVAVLFRHRGVSASDLEDLLHEFFVMAIEREFLARADPERGRFRGYLATAATRFLNSHWRDTGRQKRRPETGQLVGLAEGLDVPATPSLTPDEAFDLEWARATFATARAMTEAHYRARGKQEQVEAFNLREAGESWAAVAKRLGATEPAVRGWAQRVGDRLARFIRQEISGTVPDEESLEEELRYLSTVLSKAR